MNSGKLAVMDPALTIGRQLASRVGTLVAQKKLKEVVEALEERVKAQKLEAASGGR